MINTAERILNIEIEGMRLAVNNIASVLSPAIELLADTTGKVVVVGVGKSGLIGQKIAATLSSTGKPSMFLHPVEALHGDLGALQPQDSLLILSNSGSSREIAALLPVIAQHGNPILAITGHAESLLSRAATVCLCTGPLVEACPLGLAPTTSTTAALIIGDLLAILLMERSGFKVEDFAERHHGGALGQQLVTAQALMRTGQKLPLVQLDSALKDLVEEIDRGGIGTAGVCDPDGHLVGVVTDGDLRRALRRSLGDREQIFNSFARDIMGGRPKKIRPDAPLPDLIERFERFRVSSLFVVDDEDRPVGIVHLHDAVESTP